MESIMEPYIKKRLDFELFKSSICHRLKELGDIKFLIELLEQDEIRKYYKKKWYPESLYLLAMLDYLSRENDIPLCTKYNDIRNIKLKTIIFPSSVLVATQVARNDELKLQSIRDSIPEFIRFNIVENDVRNVV